MNPITLVVGAVYGMTRPRVASAAWLWFEWEYDKRGRLLYWRWVWEPKRTYSFSSAPER